MDELNEGNALDIDVDEGEPVTIRVRGDIDMETSVTLRVAVDEVLQRQPQCELLVFDMAGVDFMDSSGLSLLVAADNAGPRVEVRDPSESVRLVIEATGLQHLLGDAT
jgi:anti-anti-sigma factor